ncbi:MAG: cytochrome c-type biogenesis protein [Solirubrobacterales bacterium]
MIGTFRRAFLIAFAICAALTLLAAPAPVPAQERNASPSISGGEPRGSATLPDIEDEVMCPICGTALNLAESPQAERERAFIRELIGQGLTKEEIKERLVDEYGSEVLALPSTQGFDLAAWIVPGAAILGGAVFLGRGVGRWRREGAGPAPAVAGTPAPDADEQRRLDEDLDRYRL